MNKVWMLGLFFISIGQLNGMETGLNVPPLEDITDEDVVMCGVSIPTESEVVACQALIALGTGQREQQVQIPQAVQSSKQSLAAGSASRASDKKRKRTHTGERPYKCEICHKDFTEKSSLKTHIRVHTGEKPFVCEICHKGFTQKCSLKKHTVVHTGERLYKCEICHKGFKQSSYLKGHTVVHTGGRPYECEICHQSFRHSSNLSRHKKTHEK